MISAILPVKNEEKAIVDCLESIKWVEEVIVVDDGSTDKTAEIANKYGAKILKFSKDGNYSDRRNVAVAMAKGDWLLFIDADERITPLLKKEILEVTDKSQFNAYAIPRLNIIFGKKMKYGGWWPDYNKRLFVKDKFKRWSGDLHEEPEFEGSASRRIGHLKNYMIHDKNMSLSQMVDKTNRWSEVEAKLMLDARHPPMNLPRFFTAIVREFWLRMIKQMAFLDGPEGIIYALYQVFSRFVSYAKLWEMQQK